MKPRGFFILIFLLIKLSASAQDALPNSTLSDTLFASHDTLQWETEKIYKTLAFAVKNKKAVYRLDLSRQKLKEVPAEVFQLTELRELNLSSNKISILPPEIKALTHLVELNLSNNKIAELPIEIGNLVNLKTFHINRNDLLTLPNETGKLLKLETLDMWSNEIDSLPSTIQNLKHLKVLELRGILISDPEQARIKELLPNTTIFLSPSCNCKY